MNALAIPGKRVLRAPAANIYKFSDTEDGFHSPVAGGGGGGITLYPFDVEFGAGSDGSHSAGTVRPGTLNGLLPSNFTISDDLSNTGTYYLVLSATATDGEITGCTLAFSGSAPGALPVLQGQPPTTFDYLLGVIVDAQWFRTIGLGSLTANGVEVYRVSKTTPAPGTLPYDIYYTWGITA
jgi:hypothetical protein